jgi:hypothetical protein
MPYVTCSTFNTSQTDQDIKITTLQQAQSAGAAQTVPATGVQSGALPSGVTTTPSSVVGFNAAALAAIPTSTDTVVGKSRSATPLETGAGVLNDGVHVSPADLLAAARTATTFAAAIAANPNKYGTFASVLAPTLAPTEANPQTILTNSNGEVFQYTGTKWVLIANGRTELVVSTLTDSSNSTSGVVIAKTWTAPRAGKVRFSVKMDSILQKSGVGGRCIAYLFSSIDPLLNSTTDFSYGDGGFVIVQTTSNVVAGQVVSFGSYGNGSSGSNNSGISNGITTGMVGYEFAVVASMTYET